MVRDEYNRMRKLDRGTFEDKLNEIAGKSYAEGQADADETVSQVLKLTQEAMRCAIDETKGIGTMKGAAIARRYDEKLTELGLKDILQGGE